MIWLTSDKIASYEVKILNRMTANNKSWIGWQDIATNQNHTFYYYIWFKKLGILCVLSKNDSIFSISSLLISLKVTFLMNSFFQYFLNLGQSAFDDSIFLHMRLCNFKNMHVHVYLSCKFNKIREWIADWLFWTINVCNSIRSKWIVMLYLRRNFTKQINMVRPK